MMALKVTATHGGDRAADVEEVHVVSSKDAALAIKKNPNRSGKWVGIFPRDIKADGLRITTFVVVVRAHKWGEGGAA